MRRLLIILFTWIVAYSVLAGNLDTTFKAYPTLVKYDKNQLYYARESEPFLHFLNKLISIKNGDTGVLSIIHIGGSHIQADIYSDQLRHRFFSFIHNKPVSRGLVFPYRLARTNAPVNYTFVGNKSRWKGFRSSLIKDSSKWGITGITCELTDNHDTLFFSPSSKESLNDTTYCFDKVRVFYKASSPETRLTLFSGNQHATPASYDSLSLSQVFRFSEPVKSLYISLQQNLEKGYQVQEGGYDSISPNAEEVTGVDSLLPGMDTLTPHLTGDGLLLMGVEIINSKGQLVYHSIGVNGASFATYKRCEYFYPQLKKLTVDLAIISIGTNDAYTINFDTVAFRKRYEAMIETMLQLNKEVAIVLTVPNDCYYKKRRPNKNTRLQQAIIHGLGRKYKMPVWDLYGIMGGLGSSGKWHRNKLMSRDRVHFTRKGYDLIGDLFWQAFVEAITDNNSKTIQPIQKGEPK